MPKLRGWCFPAAALLLMLPAFATADDLAYMLTSTGQFGTIDLTTGAFTLLGALNAGDLGLGQTPDGKLYTVDAIGTLYQVNPANGGLTIVGSSAVNYYAIGSTTAGLFALDSVFNLYSINPTTGAAVRIGFTGLNPNSGLTTGGLSSGAGTLYFTFGLSSLSATLYSLNIATGAATGLGLTSIDGVGAMVFENGTLYAGSNWQGTTQADTISALNPVYATSSPVASVTGGATKFNGLAPFQQSYYFPHLVVGGGWQLTLTYINYSPQTVTCTTNFYTDTGAAFPVPFNGNMFSTHVDVFHPGQSIHIQTDSGITGGSTEGWAQSTCNGPVEASMLYRLYQQGAPVGEASVPAMTAPATKFVTFGETRTGVAYANPSMTQTATVTFTAVDNTGIKLASTSLALTPLTHGSVNLAQLLGLQGFEGHIEIASTIPIVSLSLNAEVFPVFSSLPPGQLSDNAPLFP